MMIYTNESIRRQDRLLDEPTAACLLQAAEYGVLSMQAESGGAYGIPVNFVWNGASSVYVHCAPDGRKLHCISTCNRVSFCIVGRTNVIANKFSTEYESVILHGTAHIGLLAGERMKALELLLDKYSPNDKIAGMKYAEGSLHRTEIIRIDVEQWSGKCK